jgi:hypothetical protein
MILIVGLVSADAADRFALCRLSFRTALKRQACLGIFFFFSGFLRGTAVLLRR